MSEEDALLAAIAAQPEEDTPRLAYADWLDEHDRHVRAEFIRVQIETARLRVTLPEEEVRKHTDLLARQKAILAGDTLKLLGPLAGLPVVTGFDRGFVSAIDLSVQDFLTHAELIASTRPLPKVGVNFVAERVGDFLRCPHTHCVSRIGAWSPRFATIEPEYPEDFNDLDLIDGIERLKRLERLELGGCGLGDMVCDLAFNYSLPALTEFYLSHNLITDRGVEDLLRTDLPLQLRELVLDGNAITDLGATWLAEDWPTGTANRLTRLGIANNPLTEAGRQVLRDRFGDVVQC